MNKLKVLDLFSGIGGFSYGLDHLQGFETVAFCEIDKFCQKVLKKHYPNVPIFEDIKKLTCKETEYDVICGGFPCQDISVAGLKKGITNETRSGLWFEYKRIIKEVKPRWIIIENVRNLLNNGFATVLKDLHEIGFDAEWQVIPARSVGAPHLRERVWIVAYLPNPNNFRFWPSFTTKEEKSEWWTKATSGFSDRWEVEPSICRVDDGLPSELDKDRASRVKALGNSIVPQIASIIGERILYHEESKNE